jgi:hypothetical protein
MNPNTVHSESQTHTVFLFLIIYRVICWFIGHQFLKYLLSKYDHKLRANIVSIFHSAIVILVTSKNFLQNTADFDHLIWLYIFSSGYFISDIYYSRNEIVFVVHHIATLIILLTNYLMMNTTYFYYANILYFIAEITNPLQNGYFSIKIIHEKLYGNTKESKYQFEKTYFNLFKIYSYLFITCRLIAVPIFTYYFILSITEMWYLVTTLFLCLAIVIGSLKWIQGQLRIVLRMTQNIKSYEVSLTQSMCTTGIEPAQIRS